MGETSGRKAAKRATGLATLAGVVAVTAGLSLPQRAAMAQADNVGAGLAAEVAQATASYDIPAQDLNAALLTFARRAGLQIFYDVDRVRGLRSAPLVGTFTPEQGLALLLAGTGISYRFTGANTVSLDRPGATAAPGAMQLDPVQVQGAFPVPPQAMIDNLPPPYAGGQVATGGQLGLLGNRGVMNTPFNQTSYTAQKAQDQQAKTVRDVLMDDPSVRAWGREGTVTGDNVWIRGFSIGAQNMAYGGLYGVLPTYSIMAELAERIEVLKGPGAMLFGMAPISQANIGGVVNVVPKRAPDQPLTQLTANYISAGQVGGHADVARRFGDDKQFGVRFNGAFRAGPTEINWNADQRGLAVLGLDFRGERVRLSADLGYQSRQISGQMSQIALAVGVPVPWAPNARTNQGQPWGTQQQKDTFGVVRGEVDIAERVTAYAAFGAHDNRDMALIPDRLTVSSFNGNGTPGQYSFSGYNSYLTAEAGLRGSIDTGPITHEFAFAATRFSQETGEGAVFGPAFSTNLYNPTIVARPNLPTPASVKTATVGLSGISLADTLSAAEKRVQLTVGGRLQQVRSSNYAASGATTSTYDQTALTPAVALVVKPFWENVSFYANYVQGLQQGTIVGPTFVNAGEIFPPFKSTQYEAGVKVDWGKLTTTASVFQISQPSVLTNVTTNTLFLGGEQVNQGLEFNFFGELSEGFRVLGGAMFLNAVLAKTQGGLTDGWVAPFAPGGQFNLASEWDLPFAPGLTVTGRVTYTGSQYIDATFPRRTLAEWTRLDVGARYAFENPGAKGKLLVARFNVENLLDANYWAGGGGTNNLLVSAPRSFRLSLTADF